MRFFLLNALHREMDKKDDLSFRYFLKLLLELMLGVNICRDGCLLGIENICVGLGKEMCLLETAVPLSWSW